MRYFLGATIIITAMVFVTIQGIQECNQSKIEIARKEDKPKLTRPRPWDPECIACVHMRKDGTYTVDKSGCIR